MPTSGVYRKKVAEITAGKAKKILKDGEVKGHKLTKKQKGFFGARAGVAPHKRA